MVFVGGGNVGSVLIWSKHVLRGLLHLNPGAGEESQHTDMHTKPFLPMVADVADFLESTCNEVLGQLKLRGRELA